jgi:hypothetical protein
MRNLEKTKLLFIFFLVSLLSVNLVYAARNGARQINISCDRWPDFSSLERFGNDCVRIANAKTNEEKAIALWRFIQQCTEVGSVPKEPAYGKYYILSPLKVLNVYGVHWCDGLSRIMNMTWRSLGYRAQKLYKFGHTLADCWWKDQDGIERWHVFDVSQHWYVYDRTGNHIATKDELALDHSLLYIPSRTPIPSWPSPLQPSYVHAGHLNIKPHKTGIDLREGESIRFLWGNEGKPYYNLFGKKARKDFEHGPYPITYGNGRLIYSPDLSTKGFLKALDEEPVNLACTEQDGLKPALHPRSKSKKAMAIFRISLPYVISDVWLDARLKRENPGDMIRFSISTDGREKWRPVWETGGKLGIIDLHAPDFCDTFDPSKKKKPREITPFGRYEFLMKLEMKAARDISGCGIDRLSIVTVFQHNLFSLPMLWPGINHITVRGDLNPQSKLRITYVWDDKKGKERIHAIVTRSLPFQYEMFAEGKKWEDVVCRSMDISVLPKSEKNEAIPVSKSSRTKITQRHKSYDYPPEKSIGNYYPKPLKSSRHYIDYLQKQLVAQNNPKANEISLKKLSKRIGQNVLALGALQDPSAKVILEEVIKYDITHPFINKVWACQALFQSVGQAAAPVMLRVLERDETIIFHHPREKRSRDAMWLHVSHMAAAILAQIEEFEGRERAADLIAGILEGKRTRKNPRKIRRGEEICWGLIKALGKLGSKKHIPLLRSFLREGSDATAVAVLALKDIGDSSIIPEFVRLLKDFKYSPIGLYTIKALGELGNEPLGHHLHPFLNHWDEDFRGAAATALAEMGDRKAIPLLEEMLKTERFPWVVAAAEESLKRLVKTDRIN